jgi:hypothetical protein
VDGGFTTLYALPDGVEIWGGINAEANSILVSTLSISGPQRNSAVDSVTLDAGASTALYEASGNAAILSALSDGQTIFIAQDGTILAMPVSGGTPRTVYETTNTVSNLALDGTTLYWEETVPDSLDTSILAAPVSLRKSPLDGSSPPMSFTSPIPISGMNLLAASASGEIYYASLQCVYAAQ